MVNEIGPYFSSKEWKMKTILWGKCIIVSKKAKYILMAGDLWKYIFCRVTKHKEESHHYKMKNY